MNVNHEIKPVSVNGRLETTHVVESFAEFVNHCDVIISVMPLAFVFEVVKLAFTFESSMTISVGVINVTFVNNV